MLLQDESSKVVALAPETSASLNFQDWLKLRIWRPAPALLLPPLPPLPLLPPPVPAALPPNPAPDPPLELDAPPEAPLPPEALEPSFPAPARPAEQAKKGEATAKTKNKVTGSCRPAALFTSVAPGWRPRRRTIDFE
jgi:hypothetical protein